MKTKHIDWSYPTSSNAARFGHARTGCWTVSVQHGINPAVAIRGFRERADALAFARTLPEPWNYLHLRYFPGDGDAALEAVA